MPKKPLYFGDPNATLTMCHEKLRRHLPKDLIFMSVNPNDPGPGEEPHIVIADRPVGPIVGLMCKHCKQNPVIEKSEPI